MALFLQRELQEAAPSVVLDSTKQEELCVMNAHQAKSPLLELQEAALLVGLELTMEEPPPVQLVQMDIINQNPCKPLATPALPATSAQTRASCPFSAEEDTTVMD
jgi:hypothetical protein